MAISTSIDLKLTSKEKKELSIKQVLECLFKDNWTIHNNGNVIYLPIGDDGDYNWISEILHINDVNDILSFKEAKNETVGIVLFEKSSLIGVQLLYFGGYDISFNLSINTLYNKTLINTRIIDANWYLERLVAPLIKEYYLEGLCIQQLGS